jgi:hypothetical protein
MPGSHCPSGWEARFQSTSHVLSLRIRDLTPETRCYDTHSTAIWSAVAETSRPRPRSGAG